MNKLRDCECEDSSAEVVNSYGTVMFVHCSNCGARGKSFPTGAKVGDMWPREAAEQAWNNRVMEEDDHA